MDELEEEKPTLPIQQNTSSFISKTPEEIFSYFVKKQVVSGIVGTIFIFVLFILLLFFSTWCLLKIPTELGPLYGIQLKIAVVSFGVAIFMILITLLYASAVSIFSPDARAIKEIHRFTRKMNSRDYLLMKKDDGKH